MPSIGEYAPDFTGVSDSGEELALSSFRGKKVVLYFYPKDETPGCTKEACSFRDNLARVTAQNAVVLGVSTDSVASHQQFKANHSLPFPLVADEDKRIVQAYDVWKERERDGQKFMGTVRTTYIIDEQGKIAHVFNNVQVDGHVDEVLAHL